MKSRFLVVAAVFALLSPAILATELPYSFVQGSWESVDPDVGDSGTGPMLDVSYGVTNLVHLVGSYENVDFDASDRRAIVKHGTAKVAHRGARR